jgi:hypothetical protein
MPVSSSEVDWIGFLTGPDRQVVFVGELFTREDHRDADRGEQARERELDAPIGVAYVAGRPGQE